ncbi:hypothetical protein SCUCBS95973_007880 [Sporothrix curviconia]|uniref:Uncharacterized protein n=1 Tax=Sporothrix curviconia TaxID=1260050 RepID=A0ABP0CHN8_9PEZI
MDEQIIQVLFDTVAPGLVRELLLLPGIRIWLHITAFLVVVSPTARTVLGLLFVVLAPVAAYVHWSIRKVTERLQQREELQRQRQEEQARKDYAGQRALAKELQKHDEELLERLREMQQAEMQILEQRRRDEETWVEELFSEQRRRRRRQQQQQHGPTVTTSFSTTSSRQEGGTLLVESTRVYRTVVRPVEMSADDER